MEQITELEEEVRAFLDRLPLLLEVLLEVLPEVLVINKFSIQRSKPTQWVPFLATTFPESEQVAEQIQVREGSKQGKTIQVTGGGAIYKT